MQKSDVLTTRLFNLALAGLLAALSACQPATRVSPTATSLPATPTPVVTEAPPLYLDAQQPVAARVDDLLARMTVEEKIGQITQVEKNSLQAGDITRYFIGSVLSGGGGSPASNWPPGWAEMVDGYQQYALGTRLAIPMIYGVDAVHGHGNMYGATIFPHNIGLGAAGDPALVEKIGLATAEEMLASGIPWNFAPVVAVVQDTRWGRTYEGYSENTELVTQLGAAYVKGQLAGGVLVTPKHFIGDGATVWGTSQTYTIDQGDMQVDEATLRAKFLPPYQAALDAGAMSVMISFSSWNGTKMHAQKYLITDLLKGELGFQGFVVSDWQAIDQLPGDYYSDVVTSLNAGLDMIMVPTDYRGFIASLTKAVESGDVPMERIDDAVRRILRVKFELGLFEHPYSDPAFLPTVRSEEHLALARAAVRQSLVLLKNENAALPLDKDTPLIFVAGAAANDIGLQCGGWTIQWQGQPGKIQPGTTILEGIQAAVVSPTTQVVYDARGLFADTLAAQGQPAQADVAVVVVAEPPYAEGKGDSANPALTAADIKLIEQTRARSQKLIVVVLSGRPVELTAQLPLLDALVAAWLPGTEGQGVADGLFGDYPFTGKLPYTWQRWGSQLPFDFAHLPTEGCAAPLFPYGYGLGQAGSQPVEWLDCPAP